MPKKERLKNIYEGMINKIDIPKRFQNKNFDNYDPYKENMQAFQKVKEYVDTFEERYKNGDWLVLSGGYGLGKTHLSLAAAKEIVWFFAGQYLENRPNSINYGGASEKCIFKTSSQLVQEIRNSYDSDAINEKQLMDRFKGVPLLIIDDLGTEKASEWQHEKMYLILNYRYNQMKNTIITTNLDTSELKKQVSSRVVERMIEAASGGEYLWKFTGKSYRRVN